MEENELLMAERLAENERDAGIAAARAALQETHPDFDGENCVGCGNEIPAARLALKAIRCVECKSRLEAQQRGFAGRSMAREYVR